MHLGVKIGRQMWPKGWISQTLISVLTTGKEAQGWDKVRAGVWCQKARKMCWYNCRTEKGVAAWSITLLQMIFFWESMFMLVKCRVFQDDTFSILWNLCDLRMCHSCLSSLWEFILSFPFFGAAARKSLFFFILLLTHISRCCFKFAFFFSCSDLHNDVLHSGLVMSQQAVETHYIYVFLTDSWYSCTTQSLMWRFS